MNQDCFIKLNSFIGVDFTCDKCQKNFQRGVAYSVASDGNKLGGNYTYCENCCSVEGKKNDLETKLKVIKILSNGELRCLFCEKKDTDGYCDYGHEEHDKDGKGVFLCGRCQNRYNLLKEIEEERKKLKYCLND